jgi:large subunit ribosomal protein L25
VSGLPHSDKIKYLEDEDTTVAHVVTIREEVVATPEAAAEVVAGATAGTPTEPEVAKKGKGEAAPADAAAKKPEAGAKK